MQTTIGFCTVSLSDDGSLDTVIDVDSKYGSTTCRFDSEYASAFRDDDGAMTDDGFAQLAAEAIDDHFDQLEIDA
jgi:hypothetical protein